jgi:hypothetical protein
MDNELKVAKEREPANHNTDAVNPGLNN